MGSTIFMHTHLQLSHVLFPNPFPEPAKTVAHRTSPQKFQKFLKPLNFRWFPCPAWDERPGTQSLEQNWGDHRLIRSLPAQLLQPSQQTHTDWTHKHKRPVWPQLKIYRAISVICLLLNPKPQIIPLPFSRKQRNAHSNSTIILTSISFVVNIHQPKSTKPLLGLIGWEKCNFNKMQ